MQIPKKCTPWKALGPMYQLLHRRYLLPLAGVLSSSLNRESPMKRLRLDSQHTSKELHLLKQPQEDLPASKL
jgi:hypothetical protein